MLYLLKNNKELILDIVIFTLNAVVSKIDRYNKSCHICNNALDLEDTTVLSCGHEFHDVCINNHINTRCPDCNATTRKRKRE